MTYPLAILLMILAAGTDDMTLASRQRGFGNLCMLGNLTCVVILFLIAVF